MQLAGRRRYRRVTIVVGCCQATGAVTRAHHRPSRVAAHGGHGRRHTHPADGELGRKLWRLCSTALIASVHPRVCSFNGLKSQNYKYVHVLLLLATYETSLEIYIFSVLLHLRG